MKLLAAFVAGACFTAALVLPLTGQPNDWAALFLPSMLILIAVAITEAENL